MKQFYIQRLLQVLPFIFLIPNLLFAQDDMVQGTVTDKENGETLVSAIIKIKGTTSGTTTDLDGNFTLLHVKTTDILEVSFMGYIKQEIEVGAQTVFDIKLSQDLQQLDEVIVVGYGTTTKKNITTSVVSVKPDNISKAANSSASDLLVGQAAGLETTQLSSEPGGKINLSIRGGGNPLIVVDGIILPSEGLEPGNGSFGFNGVNRGGLAGINPADIESMEVLKDASAAIYGVNAANGVILITTKKGKAGRLNASYSGSRSYVENVNYLQPLSAKEYKQYYNYHSHNQYLIQNEMQPFGPNEPGAYQFPYAPSEINKTGAGTDWLGQVLQPGSIDNHSVNINGGTEKALYYFSGSYFNQEGSVKNSGMTRYNANLNTTFNLSDKLTFNASINASRNEYKNSMAGVQNSGAGSQDYGALQSAIAYPATLPIRDSLGNYTQFGVIGNPVSLLDIQDKTNAVNILSNFALEYEILKDKLNAKVLYGNNYETSSRDFFIPSTTFYAQLNLARGALSNQQRENHTFESIITYNEKISKAIDLNVVAGAGQYFTESKGAGYQYSAIHDAIGNSNTGAATGPVIIASNKWEEERRSFFARGNINLYDKYLVSLSYRYDGVDKFFPEKKYAGFPSASLAWKISSEKFLENSGAVELIKLRASYGVLGNKDALGARAYGVFAPDNSAVAFNNTNLIFPYALEGINWPNLTWERTIVQNLGLDFDFFKGRISGSVDVYQKDITDILRTIPAPALSFMATVPVNGGHQVNRGIEIAINTGNIRTKRFAWDTQFNFSKYEIRWKEFAKGEALPAFMKTGDYVNAHYYYPTNGILQTEQEIPAHQPSKAQLPGAPLFVDINADDTVNFSDIVMASPYPDFYLGMGNTFSYDRFDLSIFIYGKFGIKKRNYTYSWADPVAFTGNVQSSTKVMDRVWSTYNPNGDLPGIGYNESSLGLPTSTDVNLDDASFVRVRNITLGYNFNTDKLNGIEGLRLYFDVQNPILFTTYDGIDPETDEGGSGIKGSPGSYPMVRTYSAGINVNF